MNDENPDETATLRKAREKAKEDRQLLREKLLEKIRMKKQGEDSDDTPDPDHEEDR